MSTFGHVPNPNGNRFEVPMSTLHGRSHDASKEWLFPSYGESNCCPLEGVDILLLLLRTERLLDFDVHFLENKSETMAFLAYRNPLYNFAMSGLFFSVSTYISLMRSLYLRPA